ncbi:RnfH family protein [Rhodoferax bucti]|uniref:RnfH family protein n=1 Tax=Rhodoferax bucti TaxID=2576305 RepID=UPI0011082A39|nr:RnfH family protein [Rhodoferax bucti]
MATDGTLRVLVVYGHAPRRCQQIPIDMPDGATVAQAVAASGLLQALPAHEVDELGLAVWGRRVTAQHALRDGDRLEIVRPLTVDPKVARRERFAKQGAKSAGLFSKQRQGSKAGY